jgi:hypothetical protein
MNFVRTVYPDARPLTTKHFVYSLFGLQIHCNIAIPEISSVQLHGEVRDQPSSDTRVEIQLASTPYDSQPESSVAEELVYTSDYKDPSGEASLKIWRVEGGRFLRLAYFDGTQFWLNQDVTEIWATWPANLTIEDTATYLLGPVLGLVLRLRGVTCLHASAISFGEFVVAFVGSEGAGKSTTAAGFSQQGLSIVSDDVVALTEMHGAFYVHPAYPYLCLWPESVETIYGSADALPRFSLNYEKRCLSLKSRQALKFEARVLPLKAIYVLGERRSHLAPKIEAISAQKSILALVANTFATNVLETEMRAKEFSTLGRLVPNVRIREVFAHQDLGRLPELCRLILEDVEGMVADVPNAARTGE